MAIYELYSRRQKRLREGVSDIFQYTDFPEALRNQILQIFSDVVGEDYRYEFFSPSGEFYQSVDRILCREYGSSKRSVSEESSAASVHLDILTEEDPEKFLDIVELVLKKFDVEVRHRSDYFNCLPVTIDEAIHEFNYRCREAGVGYQFENGEIIRVDSQFLHADAVKPTLQILGNNPSYIGVNDEFLSAHEHYRHQNYKECLNDCLKAFESMMKSIHVKHCWEFNQTDTAKKLINGCLVNGLIPDYMQEQFSSFKSLLLSGIPTIRNKEGGHGQGPEISTVPEHLASYALHLTASNLLFLAKCEEQL